MTAYCIPKITHDMDNLHAKMQIRRWIGSTCLPHHSHPQALQMLLQTEPLPSGVQAHPLPPLLPLLQVGCPVKWWATTHLCDCNPHHCCTSTTASNERAARCCFAKQGVICSRQLPPLTFLLQGLLTSECSVTRSLRSAVRAASCKAE
jgi:hypothetical protein